MHLLSHEDFDLQAQHGSTVFSRARSQSIALTWIERSLLHMAVDAELGDVVRKIVELLPKSLDEAYLGVPRPLAGLSRRNRS